jgi:hypothetical protein
VLSFDAKLRRTAKRLRQWGQRQQSALSLLFQIANEVLLRLDSAMEDRQLSDAERRLRAFLKGKRLALASLERVRLRQRARVVIYRRVIPIQSTSTRRPMLGAVRVSPTAALYFGAANGAVTAL